MIAYKVVQPGSRASCVALGKYRKIYSPGSRVIAREGTLGIFCFETIQQAENWIASGLNKWVIIPVKGLGEGIKPSFIVRHDYIEDDLRIEEYSDWLRNTDIPKGTICFKSVEVLDV